MIKTYLLLFYLFSIEEDKFLPPLPIPVFYEGPSYSFPFIFKVYGGDGYIRLRTRKGWEWMDLRILPHPSLHFRFNELRFSWIRDRGGVLDLTNRYFYLGGIFTDSIQGEGKIFIGSDRFLFALGFIGRGGEFGFYTEKLRFRFGYRKTPFLSLGLSFKYLMFELGRWWIRRDVYPYTSPSYHLFEGIRLKTSLFNLLLSKEYLSLSLELPWMWGEFEYDGDIHWKGGIDIYWNILYIEVDGGDDGYGIGIGLNKTIFPYIRYKNGRLILCIGYEI